MPYSLETWFPFHIFFSISTFATMATPRRQKREFLAAELWGMHWSCKGYQALWGTTVVFYIKTFRAEEGGAKAMLDFLFV